MTIFHQWKGVSVTREFLQPTEETPIKPSLFNSYEWKRK